LHWLLPAGRLVATAAFVVCDLLVEFNDTLHGAQLNTVLPKPWLALLSLLQLRDCAD
jgi:hypothetical protein